MRSADRVLREAPQGAQLMAEVVVRATGQLLVAVKGLERNVDRTVLDACVQVKRLEEEGDSLYHEWLGRLFEGTPGQMWSSLQKILRWPDDTRIYCAHEYTQSNARFALTVEPQNPDLRRRAKTVAALRAAGQPTVPSTLGEERKTNPFLRPQSADLRTTIALNDADDVEVFAKTRALKDSF